MTYICNLNGAMAEWLGTGLQNLLQQFDSASHLQQMPFRYLRGIYHIWILLGIMDYLFTTSLLPLYFLFTTFETKKTILALTNPGYRENEKQAPALEGLLLVVLVFQWLLEGLEKQRYALQTLLRGGLAFQKPFTD